MRKISKVEVANLVEASIKAVNYLDKFNRKRLYIPRSFFLDLHKTVLAHKPKYAGRYRTATDELKIEKKTFEIIESWRVELLLLELIDFINNKHK